jgi:hypothetical protein
MSVARTAPMNPTVLDSVAAPADTRPDPGFLDTFRGQAYAVTPDAPGATQKLRNAAYMELMSELTKRGHNPSSFLQLGTPATMLGTVSPYNLEKIWGAAVREGLVSDDRAAFESQWRENVAAEQARNADTGQRGGTVPWLLGGMAGLLASDPINSWSMIFGAGAGASLLRLGLTEAGINMAVETVSQPIIAAERAQQGRPGLTMGEAAANIGFAGAAGFALPVAVRGGIDLAQAGVRQIDQALPLDRRLARKLEGQAVPEGDVATEAARRFVESVPEYLRTPDQQAGLTLVNALRLVEDASPFARSSAALDVHKIRLFDAMVRITEGAGEGPGASLARGAEGASGRAVRPFDFNRYLDRTRAAESGGDDAAQASTSSAAGRYQFTEGTFKGYWKKVYGGDDAAAQAAWATRRTDPQVQEALMRALTQDNVRALENAGQPVTDGTAYLAHFLGIADALRVLRAGDDAPVSAVVRQASIAANPGVFRDITSASELVAWAEAKMGQAPRAGVPARGGDDAAALMSEVAAARASEDAAALEALRARASMADLVPTVEIDGRPAALRQFTPEEIGVDAKLMQFKSGGDESGVIDTLRGVTRWDSLRANVVTVWQARDGRLLIADGHQRLGLARRIKAADPDQDIRINAYVMREEDGFSARDARVLTALKNIDEGSGSPTDAAKVLRDVGEVEAEDLLASLPPGSALVRDGRALARLSPEAFGAVVNEVIPESHAAAIGQLAPDPNTHMALVELLASTSPPNRAQADSIVRQAVSDGFSREVQEELFGTRETALAIYAFKARALDRVLAELRKMKGAFSVAARNEETLTSAGNRIDVEASEAAAASNAKALALVNQLALRKGNAVSEILTNAAERLAAGERLASVVRDAVNAITRLDLDAIIRTADEPGTDSAAGRAGPGDGGGGSAGRAADEAGAASGLADRAPAGRPAELDPARPDPDEPGLFGPAMLADDAMPHADPRMGDVQLQGFSDPVGPAARLQADGLLHDIRAQVARADPPEAEGARLDLGEAVDPAAAARARQENDLRAADPLRGGRKTGQAQDPTMPEGLFGGAVEPELAMRFNDVELPTGRDGALEKPATLLARLDAEEAAIKAMRDCL